MVVTPDKITVHIRWMINRDLPEVLSIESDSYANPWTEDDFLHILRQRSSIGMVAEGNNKTLGFIIYNLEKGKIDLLKLVVHPNYRYRRIGRQMMDKITGKLSMHGRTSIEYPVWDGNLSAHLFLKTCGFKVARVDRNVHENGDSNYLFEYRFKGINFPLSRGTE